MSKTYFIACLLMLSFVISCADFIEYPLENKSVELLAPHDGLVSADTIVHFWWGAHEDARFYRLQVVSPDFRTIESAIIDTLVEKDKISLELQEGIYTWRVRPENYGSVGEYNYRIVEVRP